MKHLARISILFVLLINILSSGCINAQSVDQKKSRILLLNSYHKGLKWTDDITDAVFDYIESNNNVTLFVEYMDSKRFQDSTIYDALFSVYHLKYSQVKLDGIICSDNNALDFAIRYGNSIWGMAPVVFCGINNPEDYRNEVDTNRVCGIEEKLDIRSTLEIIKTLQPDLNEIVLLGDETQAFPMFQQQFESAVQQIKPAIHYRVVKVEGLNQLDSILNGFDSNGKALYLLSMFLNNDGSINELAVGAYSIFKKYDIPVYGNWDFLIPNLIVGGKIVSGKNQGLLASQMMLKRLSSPTDLVPFITPCPQELIFDSHQLNRFKIDERKLPHSSIIANRNLSFYQKYRTQSSIALGLFILLFSIILLLISSMIQRRRAELELLKSENRLELALEGANQGLWDINLDDNSVFINKQFASLLGYSNPKEMDLSVLNWSKIFYPDDLEHIKEAYFLHTNGKIDSMNCEVRLIKRNKELVWIAIHGKITEKKNGAPVRVTGSILNISTQKEFEHELLLAKEKAEESDMLKSSFLANMSHEIRTPMNAIVGFADLIMADSIEPSERKNYLSIIKRSGESLLNLINDIIDISKIESGQLQMIFEDFNLNNMFDNIEKVSNTLIKNSNKSLNFKTIKGVNEATFFIRTDPYRLEQVLLNLVTNAIKFTQDGSIEMGYFVVNSTTLTFYVKDTGIGIADEHKQIIFDRFRQADETMAKKFGGTGLGLAICNSLVQMLGGKFEVDSELNKGAMFSFNINVEISTPVAGMHF